MSLIGSFAVAHKFQHERPNIICTFSLLALQVFVIGGFYLACPGYIVPFLNNHIARWIVTCLLIWNLFGLLLLLRLPYKSWRLLLIIMFFVMPLIMTPMLGPAVVTLVNAFAAR